MIDYTGLRKRPTFEDFVDYLANRQETIRYPDRFAKQIREHPYLTQLDSEGLWEMEELDKKRAEQEYKERTVRQVANQNNVSAQVIRAVASSASSPPPGQMGPQPGTQTGPQKGPGTKQFNTNAPPVSGDLAQKMTSLEQGLASIEQELARRKADDAKRDNTKKQQITQMVARNLGQQSSDVGVIPYISIATDEEDNPRSRSPKRNRKSAKTEDALMLQAEPQTGASSTPKRNRKSAKTGKKKGESVPTPTPDDDDFYKDKTVREIKRDLIELNPVDISEQGLRKMKRRELLDLYKPYVKRMTPEYRKTINLPG
jgi:hypothetical protein